MKTSLLPSPRVVILAASLALAPCICVAASAAELLEKGIYTEETKGDVDGAIAIYKQLVAEARANHALGAQAQYRLALCLEKKGRTSEATAAFEKLISDFPSEKELVAQAREHLPADITLGPVTWVDGERLKYVLTVADGTEIGAMETSADLVQADGPKVWRVGRNMSGGGQSVSRVDVEPESFRPLASYWKHTMLGEVSAVYGKDGIELKKAGSAEVTKLPLEKTVFDNEECFHLLRRLPLKEGYKATINVASTLGGGIIPLGFEVVKKETLTVPAGKFECFKLQLSVGQALWFADNAQRPLVKFEGGGAVGELAAITQRKAGAPIAFRDDDLGITFTAPADWMVHRFGKGPLGKMALIRTFDSGADATDGGMRLFATDTLPAVARQSPRAWAESEVAKNKELKVRAGSWKNVNVAGRVGVSCVVDFTEGGKPRAQEFVYAIGPKMSEFFVIASAPEKFDALRAAFETVITSYRTTK